MSRLLVIISKDKPDLYEYLRRTYAMQDGVQVVRDRMESRQKTQPGEADDRSLERRRDPGGDAELIFREVGAPASSLPRFMFADRDWTNRGSLQFRAKGPSLAWPGLAP